MSLEVFNRLAKFQFQASKWIDAADDKSNWQLFIEIRFPNFQFVRESIDCIVSLSRFSLLNETL